MKKRLVLFFGLLLAVFIILVSGGNTISGKAAGVNAPLAALAPTAVYVYGHNIGDPYTFSWWIHMDLTKRNRWNPPTPSSGGTVNAATFRGQLYVQVNHAGATPPFVSATVDIVCSVAGGTIQLTSAPTLPPIAFSGAHLNCNLPSIKNIAITDLGYPYTIHPYEDFRDPPAGQPSLQVKFRAQGSSGAAGTIFKHPSMELLEPSGGTYKARIYDDYNHELVGSTNQREYNPAEYHFNVSSSTTSPIITFALTPSHVNWSSALASSTTGRAGKNFAWCMNAVPFTIGNGFIGSIGDLDIDPRTSQNTNGMQSPGGTPTPVGLAANCTETATITPTPTRTSTVTFTPIPLTRTATFTPTYTATIPTPTYTPTINCNRVTSVITVPFTFDGAGTFCWQASSLGTFVNSWKTTRVLVNGMNVTNLYVASGSYPAKINGFYYVSYNSDVAFGHFEAR